MADDKTLRWFARYNSPDLDVDSDKYEAKTHIGAARKASQWLSGIVSNAKPVSRWGKFGFNQSTDTDHIVENHTENVVVMVRRMSDHTTLTVYQVTEEVVTHDSEAG